MDTLNITCNATIGMNPQDKEIYFKHMELRHKEEQERLAQEREERNAYKAQLIESIKSFNPRIDVENLKKLSIARLERIHDTI